MHFGGILTGLAQNIDDSSEGVLGFFGPFRNFHYSLVAVFTAFQLVLRDEDVVGQSAGFRQQESIVLADLQSSYEGCIGTFQNLDDLTFQAFLLAFGTQGHFYLVVVHGMGRIPFGNEDRFSSVFRNERVLSVAFALESTRQNLSLVIQFVSAFFYFDEEIIFNHFLNDVCTEHLQWMSSQVESLKQLFEAECFQRPDADVADKHFYQLFFLHAFSAFLFFLFFSHVVPFLKLVSTK